MQNPQENAGDSQSCCEWPRSIGELEECVQKLVRTEPAKAVGIAFIAGLILTILPVGRLVAALVRVMFLLIRPLLMVLGAMKVCEELEKRNHR